MCSTCTESMQLKQEKKLKLPPFIRISCLAILSKTTKGNFNFVVDFLHIFFTMFVCEYNKFLIFNQVHSYAVRVANQQWPLCCTPKKCKRSVAKWLSHTELFQLYHGYNRITNNQPYQTNVSRQKSKNIAKMQLKHNFKRHKYYLPSSLKKKRNFHHKKSVS